MAYTTNFGMRNSGAANPGSTGTNYLNQLGFGNLLGSAKSTVQDLLSGLPSADQTKTANAYFGAQSGMPNSDFVRNRGYDLYQQKAETNKQSGLQNLNQLIASISQPELSNQAQQLQNAQFNAQLGQQGDQFSQELKLKDFLAQLQAMGLGSEIASGKPLNLPTFNF